MRVICTKGRLYRLIELEISRHELSTTAVLIVHKLVELILPNGPLKRLPEALNLSETDLAYILRRDPRHVRYAVQDLLQAELIERVEIRETDSQGRVVFSQECFDLTPLLKRCGGFLA